MNFNITLNASDRATSIIGRFSSAIKEAWSSLRSGTTSGAINGLVGLSTTFTALSGGIGIAIGAFNRLLSVGSEYLRQQSEIERWTNRLGRTIGDRARGRAEAAEITNSPLRTIFEETTLIAASNNLRRMTNNALGGAKDLQLLADVAVDTDQDLQTLAGTIGLIVGRLQAGDTQFSRYALQLIQNRTITADVVAEMQRMVDAGRSAGQVVEFLFNAMQRQHGGAFAEINDDLNQTARLAQAMIDDASRSLTSNLYPALRDFGISIKAVLLTGLDQTVTAIKDAAAYLGGARGNIPTATTTASEQSRLASVNAARAKWSPDQADIDAELKAIREERAKAEDIRKQARDAGELAAVQALAPMDRANYFRRKSDEAKTKRDDMGASDLERATAALDYEKYAAEYRRSIQEYSAAMQAAAEQRIRQTEEEKRLAAEVARNVNDQIREAVQANQQKAIGQANEQRQFADNVAAGAARARERFLNPALVKQEERAAKDRQREDDRISKLAARARAAGYQIQWAPGGEAQAIKTGNMGPSSDRLRRALELDAMQNFAAQQKIEADRLQIDANQIAIDTKRILEQIAENTKAGPIV